ncbi:MAG: alpha/beta fold hydrolase, partial [Spirochaetales bacterium]
MILEYAVLGRGKPLVILHGLLGSSENWNGTGSRLGAFYTVYVPDARNHGRSPHTEEMNFPSMAGDVLEFMDAAGLASCFLLGHSMGGKTAMEVALQAPDRVNRLIVADMGPARHEAHFSDVLSALDGYD